jgi:2-polyprenyl-3-methyl-5-hydroxy-6-metoxy-1,4-benzoquinol methylase
MGAIMQTNGNAVARPEYYNRVKGWMLSFIADGPNRILDLGCGAGRLGQRLREAGKVGEMYGVELCPEVAEEAAKIYDRVIVGDAEKVDFDFLSSLDYVICGDILEHLQDPYTVVRKIMEWLKPGGKLLVCLPNIRNYRILQDLALHGEWKYTDAGILDQTHLRFFTRQSCKRMLREAGFEVYHDHMVVDGGRKGLFDKLTCGLFEEFLGAQIFVCGRKSV